MPRVNEKSYTTIEVILIIILISVWAVILLPRFGGSNLFAKANLKTATYNIASDIRHTRGLAITNNRPYIINFDFTQNNYKIYQWSIAPANQVGETKKIPSKVAGAGSITYTFSYLGEAAGTGATTFSISSGEKWTVSVIRATGTVHIDKP
jgi:Tfp pilus assembly protein FimT